MEGKNRWYDRGQGMVEFAIVFPLLLLLLFGIFEFGRIMFAYSAAVSASREAARYGAAILDTGGGIPQYEDCAGIREAAKRIGQFTGISDSDITIKYSNSSGVYSTSCPPGQEVQGADTISVTVSTSVTPITPLGNFSAIPIQSSSSRTILKSVKLGTSGTGAGSVTGALTDVNFKTTGQVAEESQGTISVVLQLNQAATDIVTIPFSVTGTALPGGSEDYLMTASPVTINPGQKTATIYITLNNDGIDEGNETIVIGIDPPINATKGPQDIHTITIVDPPVISFTTTSSSHTESDPTAAMMVELSKGSTQNVSVSFNYGGSAVWGSGADYVTWPSTLTIPAGSLTGMVTFRVMDDTTDEHDEQAVITMASPVNGSIGANSTHTATIIDNDGPPQVSFFSPNQIVSEEIGVFTTSLTLSEASGKDILIPYSLSGTTTSGDYLIHDSSPLFVPAGSTSVDIHMDILEGDGYEEDETLIITLEDPQNATLGSPAVQTIVITESSTTPAVSFKSVGKTVVEGNMVLDVEVELSNAWSSPVVIPFTVTGSAQPGSSGDFSISSSPLVIPVGWTHGSIQVVIHDDTIDEDLEDILISMGTIQEGLPGAVTTHEIQITDNDSPPRVFFSTYQKTAGEGAGSITVDVKLKSASVYDITVPLILSGSASDGADYSISTTNVTFLAGATSETVQFNIVDDSVYDPDEKIIVSLGAPTNAVLGSPNTFTLFIVDDELSPCEAGIHLLTVGLDSISLSIVNKGEAITFTGGSVSWQEASPNQPRITSVDFAGTNVYTGTDKPPYLAYGASVAFASLDTQVVSYQFDGELGTGEHTLVANFSSTIDSRTCSVTEIFNIH